MAKSSFYDWALRISAKVDPSVQQSAKKASGLISSIVKADLIASGVKTAASAVKNFIGDSVSTYTNFEQSLANAGAIAGATGDDLQALKKAAKDAGASTAFTAAQAADALGYMALAGWDVKTSTQSLTPVLKMAQATGADLATTSDQVTDSMSAMGIKTNELNQYLDVLVQTNNKSNTTAAQLMDAMKGAGSAATAAGLNYKQTATALGILANNGVKGAEAGTALNSMLMRMTSKGEALKAYKSLGVAVFDAKGQIRDFGDILRDTDKALSKLNDKQRAKAIASIAGVNYAGQYQFLLKGVRAAKDGSSEWGKLAENINNAGGALETMNAKATDTLSGAMTRFGSAVDAARIEFFEKFGPDLKVVVDYLASAVIPRISKAIDHITTPISNVIQFIKAFKNTFIDTTNTTASKFQFISKYGYDFYNICLKVKYAAYYIASGFSWITDLGARWKDLTNFVKEHETALTVAGIAVAGLTTAIIAYNAASIAGAIASHAIAIGLGVYSAAVSVATAVTTAFGAVMAFVTSPIFLVVAAITAVVAGCYLLYKNWQKVCNFLMSIWDKVCTAVSTAFKWAFKQICDILGVDFQQAMQTLTNAWNNVKLAFTTVVNFIISYWKGVINGIVSAWSFACNVLKTSWQMYMNYLTTAWNFIKSAFSSVCNFVVTSWRNAINNVVSILQFIKQALTVAVQNVKIIFNGIIDFIQNVFAGNWSAAWQSITGIFSGIFENLKTIAVAPLNWIIQKVNTAINAVNSVKIPDWVPGVGGKGANLPNIPALASGGIATKPTTALIGEGGESEAILPLSKLDSLLKNNTAGGIGGSVTFAPVINITGGSSNESEIKQAMNTAFTEFKRMMSSYEKDKRRRSFSL